MDKRFNFAAETDLKNREKPAMLESVKRKTPTFAELKREKVESRRRDLERIRRGEATPAEIQRENALFSFEEAQSYRITNLPQVIEAIGKMRLRRRKRRNTK